MNGIEGRIAVVTGGTGALGQEVVLEMVRAGARVHVPSFDPAEAEALEARLRGEALEGGAREGAALRGQARGAGAGGGAGALERDAAERDAAERVSLREADLTDEASVRGFFRAVAEADGPPTILLNVAGGFLAAPLEETTAAAWSGMMHRNATSAFLCSREAAPGMRDAGWGRIVNVAARPALVRGAAGMSAYAAAKAAVLNLTFSLAAELRPDGITVNAVVPTTIDTPANREAMPDADRSSWLPPAQIARVLRFLASDDAAIVTGSAIALGRG